MKRKYIFLCITALLYLNTFCQPGVQFIFETGEPIRGRPLVKDNKVFFGSHNGRFYCIDAVNGREYWHFSTSGPVPCYPSIQNGIVYFTSRDGHLYAVRTSNGKLSWKFSFGKELGVQNYWDYFLSSPTLDGKLLYVGSGDGFLYCLETTSGKVVWRYNSKARIRCQPTLASNKIIFGNMSGYVTAVDKRGNEVWKFASRGVKNHFQEWGRDRTALFYSPSVNNNVVTIGGWDDSWYGIDLETGKEKWVRDYTGAWVITTGMSEGIAYAGMGVTSFVHAADQHTGNVIWRFNTKGPLYSYFSFDGDDMFFADLNGNVWGIDKRTGQQKWCFAIGRQCFCTPVISHGRLYCGADDGKLYCVSLRGVKEASFQNARRIVYWEGKKTDSATVYFNYNLDLYIRDYFRRAGYELMDSTQLRNFMLQQVQQHTRSVVVFADDRIPSILADPLNETAIIRRYLDHGGKITLLGLNPLLMHFNAGGVLQYFDTDPVSAVLGIHYAGQDSVSGLYAAPYTAEAHRMNLWGHITSYWPVFPEQVTQVLAKDEYGKATAWIKNYGGPDGTGLLQLQVPMGGVGADIASLRAAIEYGITW